MKYYDGLLINLPKDYVITLHHFCKLMHITNDDEITKIADLVAPCSNSKESNRVILDAMILSLKMIIGCWVLVMHRKTCGRLKICNDRVIKSWLVTYNFII